MPIRSSESVYASKVVSEILSLRATASATVPLELAPTHAVVVATGRATELPAAEDAPPMLPVEGSLTAGAGGAVLPTGSSAGWLKRPRRPGGSFGARLLSSPSCDGSRRAAAGQLPVVGTHSVRWCC